jgi:hypothetical protein
MFEKPMYVNDLLTTSHSQNFWNVDGITYTTATVICAALEITRRDASFNADIQVFTFNRNGNAVTVSNEEIRKNGDLLISIGFNQLANGHKIMPLNSLVAAFDGTYEENATEIEIIYP